MSGVPERGFPRTAWTALRLLAFRLEKQHGKDRATGVSLGLAARPDYFVRGRMYFEVKLVPRHSQIAETMDVSSQVPTTRLCER
jgi:hypothetical protein